MDAFFDKFAQIPLVQKVIGFVILIVLTLAVYFFVIQSGLESDIASLKNTIRMRKAELAELQKNLIKVKEFETNTKRLEKKLKEALSLLPEKSEIPTLLEKVSNLAEKAGLDIQEFQPLPEMQQDFYVKVPVKLKLAGSYHEMMNFFDAVSKLRRVVNITQVDMVRRNKGVAGFMKDGNKTIVDVNCLGVTFRFAGKDEMQAGKAKGKNKKKH